MAIFLVAGGRTAALGEVITHTEIKYIVGTGGDIDISDTQSANGDNGTVATTSVSQNDSTQFGTSDLTADVTAGVGRLGVSITGLGAGTSTSAQGALGTVQFSATAHSADFATAHSKTKPDGSPYVMNAHLNLNGGLDKLLTAEGHSGATASLGLAVVGTGVQAFGGLSAPSLPRSDYLGVVFDDVPDHAGTVDQPPPTSIPVVILGQFGVANAIDIQLLIDGIATAGNLFAIPGTATAAFTVDFGHTLTWGGIDSLLDGTTGQPLPADDWSITSESGFDYAQPAQAAAVPEPPGILLVLLAMLVFVPRWMWPRG